MKLISALFVAALTLCSLAPSIHAVEAPNENTLFKNGVFAAALGEIGLKNLPNFENTALWTAGGFQLMRFEYVAVMLGYAKAGYYDAVQPKDVWLNYQGPLLEAVLFPMSDFTGGVQAVWGKGKTVDKISEHEFNDADIRTIDLSLNFFYTIAYQLQIGLAVGTQQATLEPYHRIRADVNSDWQKTHFAKEEKSAVTYTILLRGTTL